MCIFSKLVKKKEEAFAEGTRMFNLMRNEYNMYYNTVVPDDDNRSKCIGLNVFDVTDFIYKNSSFYDYFCINTSFK